MFKYFFIYILFTSISFSQINTTERLGKQDGRIFLFGESHFVKEKYDEMKSFIFQCLDSVSSGEKITLFFELPSSLNYAFSKIKTEQDTSVFYAWFNHIYQKKDMPVSYFWLDYRDFILALIQYSEKKGIDLKLRGIDLELEFRRTAFILSSFKNKLNTEIDSFLNINYIRNDSVDRAFLLNYVNESLHSINEPNEIEILNQLKHSLLIDCTICLKRDLFMSENFFKDFNTNDAVIIGTFGLDHIISKHNFSDASEQFKMKHKIDTVNYQPFYTLIKDQYNQQIFRIGIIAFNQEMRYSNLQKSMDYNHIMNKDERAYLELLLENQKVIKIHPSEYKELSNLSSHLDYIIVYKSSNFRF